MRCRCLFIIDGRVSEVQGKLVFVRLQGIASHISSQIPFVAPIDPSRRVESARRHQTRSIRVAERIQHKILCQHLIYLMMQVVSNQERTASRM